MALKNETPNWCIAYYSFDAIFAIDLVLNFFITIPPNETTAELECDDWIKIINAYLKSWFPIDFMSIMPVDPLLRLARGQSIEFCES
jgi:hypothetical protein